MAEIKPVRKIYVTSGTGIGRTELSALDAALVDAGIIAYNMIPLSSVIPFGFEVVVEKPSLDLTRLGDRLYVVIAHSQQSAVGKSACAGLGWVRSAEGPEWGLFVEHCNRSRQFVKNDIKTSLEDMINNRPHQKFGEIQHLTACTVCIDRPVASVVAAIFALEAW